MLSKVDTSIIFKALGDYINDVTRDNVPEDVRDIVTSKLTKIVSNLKIDISSNYCDDTFTSNIANNIDYPEFSVYVARVLRRITVVAQKEFERNPVPFINITVKVTYARDLTDSFNIALNKEGMEPICERISGYTDGDIVGWIAGIMNGKYEQDEAKREYYQRPTVLQPVMNELQEFVHKAGNWLNSKNFTVQVTSTFANTQGMNKDASMLMGQRLVSSDTTDVSAKSAIETALYLMKTQRESVKGFYEKVDNVEIKVGQFGPDDLRKILFTITLAQGEHGLVFMGCRDTYTNHVTYEADIDGVYTPKGFEFVDDYVGDDNKVTVTITSKELRTSEVQELRGTEVRDTLFWALLDHPDNLISFVFEITTPEGSLVLTFNRDGEYDDSEEVHRWYWSFEHVLR